MIVWAYFRRPFGKSFKFALQRRYVLFPYSVTQLGYRQSLQGVSSWDGKAAQSALRYVGRFDVLDI
jgi:hypothetical protein